MMTIEQDLVYEIETEVVDLNEYNMLKPNGYLRVINEVIERHLNYLGINVEMTMKHNLAWALVSLSFEIIKPVEGLMKLKVCTWHSGKYGPYFRREFVFSNDSGDIMFQGSCFSVLLDVENRTVFRRKQLPFSLMDSGGEITIEARPSYKCLSEFKKVEERKVYNSYIDRLGHVNNGRYGEFAYDAFDELEKKDLDKVKRIDFYFSKELRCEDTFDVLKAFGENCFIIRCFNSLKSVISFDAVFSF